MSPPANSKDAAPSPANPNPSPPRDARLRYHAIPFLILVLAEIFVGTQLANAGSPYPSGYLDAHVGLSVLMIALGAYLVAIAYPMHLPRAWFPSWLSFVSVVIASASGTKFLVSGGPQVALYSMEGFGALALLSSILLVVFGTFPAPSADGGRTPP
jgi:hypothetical protein